MTKSFYIILVLIILGLIIVGCEKSKNPIDSQSLTHSEAVGLTKGNPNVEPTIHYFTIEEYDQGVVPGPGVNPNWTRDLLDYENVDLDKLIDFAAGKWYRIKYDVSHPDGISMVTKFIYYDANVDYQSGMDELEYVGYVIRDENVSGLQIYDWKDGKIWPAGFDNDAYSSNSTLMDQLATYNNSGAPVLGADHYGIYLWVESAGKQLRLNQKLSYMWFAAKAQGSEKLHVDNINITAAQAKGVSYTPTATAQILDDQDMPVAGAYVYGKWGGLLDGTGKYKGGPSDANGYVDIVGPDFKNNTTGEVTFIVKTLRKVDGVYDPYANSNWVWPSEEPNGSLDVPIP